MSLVVQNSTARRSSCIMKELSHHQGYPCVIEKARKTPVFEARDGSTVAAATLDILVLGVYAYMYAYTERKIPHDVRFFPGSLRRDATLRPSPSTIREWGDRLGMTPVYPAATGVLSEQCDQDVQIQA